MKTYSEKENNSIKQAGDFNLMVFESIFERSPDAIGITKVSDGTFIEVNSGFEKIFKYKKEEAVGKTSIELGIYSEEERGKLIKILKKEGRISNYPIELSNKNSDKISALIFADIVADRDEQLMFFTARDITEEKKAEKELEQHQLRLENLVEDRTSIIEEKQSRLRKYFAVISKLANEDSIVSGNLDKAFQKILKTTSEVLGVSRVGAWMYNKNRDSIICSKLYEEGKGFHFDGVELFSKDFPQYFKALKTERIIDISDAQHDKITREFTESYLKPLGITSMLDIPIKYDGKVIGVVCHEHIGVKRDWDIEEVNFAVSMADYITKTYDSAEREKSRKVLELQTQHLNLALTSARAGKFTLDFSTQNLEWDERSCDIFGISLEEFGNDVDSWSQLVLAEDLEVVLPIFQKATNDPDCDTINIEYRVEKSNNDIVYITASGYYLRDEKGKAVWLTGIHQDITEYREKENYIKDTNYRLEMAAEYTGIGMWDWYAKTDTTYGNSVWKSLFGFKEDEKAYSTWIDNLHEDDMAGVMERFLDHMTGKTELYHAEFRYNHPQRGIIWIKSTGKVIERDKNNVPVRMLGTSIDTTEHKRTEEELRSNEKKFKGIFNTVNDSLIIASMDNEIVEVNESATVQYGYTRDEFLKVKPMSLIRGDYIPVFTNFLQDLKGKGHFEGETIDLRKDGSEFNTRVKGSVVLFNNKPHFLASVSDVTAQKNAENKLNIAFEELKRSNNELEQFAYIASHDLQEPLRKVRSYTELLEERYAANLDDKAGKYINIIISGAERMQILIEDLLKFSRVSTKVQEHCSVDLNNIIDEVKEVLEIKIGEEGAIIERDDLPDIEADRSQMLQLFQNLISNAIKFRGEASPLVRIGIQNERDAMLIKVEDNGIGIDMSYSEKVFEVFQRLHSTNEYKGTGVGLAICKKIVERHGGKIWVESQPGSGSCFYLRFPNKVLSSNKKV